VRFAALLWLAALASAGCAAAPAAPQRVGPLVVGGQPPGEAGSYLGSAACGACHAGAYARWRQSAHARALAGLPVADRERSACLRCHVTGYGEPTGYRAAAPADLADVGCEACHGPGSGHARSAHPEYVPTRTGGECPPCEVNRVCRLCHTPERSPGFDLARALALVGCAR
jgi:hypothetical protein